LGSNQKTHELVCAKDAPRRPRSHDHNHRHFGVCNLCPSNHHDSIVKRTSKRHILNRKAFNVGIIVRVFRS
jgi:ABC-type nickel/cobalt efflux system permease component RcnA